MAHKQELGELMTLEQGKPLKEAIGEVPDFLSLLHKLLQCVLNIIFWSTCKHAICRLAMGQVLWSSLQKRLNEFMAT